MLYAVLTNRIKNFKKSIWFSFSFITTKVTTVQFIRAHSTTIDTGHRLLKNKRNILFNTVITSQISFYVNQLLFTMTTGGITEILFFRGGGLLKNLYKNQFE